MSSTADNLASQPAAKRAVDGIDPAFKLTRISTVEDSHREQTNSAAFTTTLQDLLSAPQTLEASVQFNYVRMLDPSAAGCRPSLLCFR